MHPERGEGHLPLLPWKPPELTVSVSICASLDLFRASISKNCPNASKKPQRTWNDITFSIKLDTFKCIWYNLGGYFGGLEMLRNVSI